MSMSTDTEAAETIRRLNPQCPESTESLQVAWLEYYYDSDDLMLDIDEQFPELAVAGCPKGCCLCTTLAITRLRPARTGCLWQVARPM